MNTPDYFEVVITQTYQPAGPKIERYRGDTTRETFPAMKDVKAFLKDKYGTSRRQPMYRDKADGSAEQMGYVYHFREDQQNRDKQSGRDVWYCQDWVTIRGIKTCNPIAQAMNA
jgi:hypothetical protein